VGLSSAKYFCPVHETEEGLKFSEDRKMPDNPESLMLPIGGFYEKS